MAGTIAASPKVASTVGLKDVVIAELTEDTEATLTYGDLQKLAGAIEASITPDNTDPDVQYYDDIEGDVLYPDPELSFKTKMLTALYSEGHSGSWRSGQPSENHDFGPRF